MGVSPFELLQNPSGRIRRGSPAAADGAGIHLEDFARRNERIHRVKRRRSIARACFVKEAFPFVKLGQQVKMPDDLRASAFEKVRDCGWDINKCANTLVDFYER